MLARLQQLIAFAWLSATVAGCVAAWAAGHAALAILVLALALTAHAAVLALEFAFMARVHRARGEPAVGRGDRVRAWWGEVRRAPEVFLWRQPFRSRLWPDRTEGLGCGVLLIHGFVCNRGLWNPWLERLHAQGRPCIAIDLEPVFGAIDDYVPRIEAGVRALALATGRPPLVVAHSMGGLALRRWWVEPGNEARIAHAITIGTPHAGTWLARFALSPNGRQMRERSAWLGQLLAREPVTRGTQMTCFWSPCDHIVFPARTAIYPGSDARRLDAVAHVDMANHPDAWAELCRRLQDEDSTPRRI